MDDKDTEEKKRVALTTEEADRLVKAPKTITNTKDYHLPSFFTNKELQERKGQVNSPLSVDGNDARLKIASARKGRTEEEGKFSSVLIYSYTKDRIRAADLCSGKLCHMNPDGTIVEGPHLHVYKEEYGDRLAIPLSQCQEFKDPQNIPVTFMDFMEYCNIQNAGAISTQGEIDFDKVE